MSLELHDILGLSAPAPSGARAWHAVLTQGLGHDSIRQVSRLLGVTQQQLRDLVDPEALSTRTRPLSQEGTNLLYRIAQSLEGLLKVFAEDAAAAWLRNPQPMLKGQVPILLLQSQVGAEYVVTAIERLGESSRKVA